MSMEMQPRKHENTKKTIFFERGAGLQPCVFVSSCLRGCIRHCVAVACAVLVAHQALAAAPLRTMYTDALAREQAVRAEFTVDQPPGPVLQEVRAVLRDYQSLVRHYPASSYSDNALWQAGRLSLDAFARFGQPQERERGIRLLRALATEYPTSRLAKMVPETLEAFDEPATPALTRVRESSNERELPEHVLVGPSTPVEPGTAVSAAKQIVNIKSIRRAVLADAIRITIELDREVPFHEERLDDPARVFVDLSSTRPAPPLRARSLRFDEDDDVVRHIRIGRHPNNTTRVVLDAVGVSSYTLYALYSPYRLVIDCVRAMSATPAAAGSTPGFGRMATPQRLAARLLVSDWGRRLPSTTPLAGQALHEASLVDNPPAAVDVFSEATSAPAPAVPPAKNLAGGFSIARQLGLGVARIVIDPGHGGHDPGAKGKGITEAELVLDVALRLEKLLQKIPGVEVVLTRRADDFVSLQERTALANREGADLFLSIHANASESGQARGIETYYLNFASNLSAASVAARENAASGQAMGALPDFVKAIALNNKLNESRDFATFVQRSMLERLRGANKTVKDLGVKQAPFVVLIGAAMPSVLAEISFITNTQEARLLRGGAYRQRIAEALLEGVRKYQMSLTTVTTVAHQ
jgi:N-acetylmuramoyl-L-alanine amidase